MVPNFSQRGWTILSFLNQWITTDDPNSSKISCRRVNAQTKKSLLKQSSKFGRKKKRSLLMKCVGFKWQLEGTSSSNPFWKTKSNASKGTWQISYKGIERFRSSWNLADIDVHAKLLLEKIEAEYAKLTDKSKGIGGPRKGIVSSLWMNMIIFDIFSLSILFLSFH